MGPERSIHSSFAREVVLADQEFDLYCQPLIIHDFADVPSRTAKARAAASWAWKRL